MARKERLPTPLEKCDLLYTPEKVKGYDYAGIGDEYANGGRLVEAVQFYERAGEEDRIRSLKATAIHAADAPLLLMIAAVLEGEVTPADWAALASAALTAEKYSAAAEAYEKAGKPEDAARAAEKLGDVLGRSKPAPDEAGDVGSAADDDLSDPRPGQAGHQAKIGG